MHFSLHTELCSFEGKMPWMKGGQDAGGSLGRILLGWACLNQCPKGMEVNKDLVVAGTRLKNSAAVSIARKTSSPREEISTWQKF